MASKDQDIWLSNDQVGDGQAQYDRAIKYFYTERFCIDGLPWLLKAAATKFPPAMLLLSDLYRLGSKGVPRDYREANRLLADAACTGNVSALEKFAKEHPVDPDNLTYVAAVHVLNEAANDGNCWACIALATQHRSTDARESARWLEKALITSDDNTWGRHEARVLLAESCLKGTHIESPYVVPRGTRLYKEAIAANKREQASIGRAISLLRAVSEDEAVGSNYGHWDNDATGELARILLHSIGEHRDLIEGESRLRKAATLGDAWAKYHLGCLHYAGMDGVPNNRWRTELAVAEDKREAACMWHEIAIQYLDGDQTPIHACAAFNYAMCNLLGVGVCRDEEEAFNYLQCCAEWGDAEAQMRTAEALVSGVGCEPDRRQALIWSYIATALGAADASSFRDRLESELTEKVVGEVQAAARLQFDVQWHEWNATLAQVRKSFPITWVVPPEKCDVSAKGTLAVFPPTHDASADFAAAEKFIDRILFRAYAEPKPETQTSLGRSKSAPEGVMPAATDISDQNAAPRSHEHDSLLVTKLELLRTRLQLTKGELAHLTGVSRMTYHSWINGSPIRRRNFKKASALAARLQLLLERNNWSAIESELLSSSDALAMVRRKLAEL